MHDGKYLNYFTSAYSFPFLVAFLNGRKKAPQNVKAEQAKGQDDVVSPLNVWGSDLSDFEIVIRSRDVRVKRFGDVHNVRNCAVGRIADPRIESSLDKVEFILEQEILEHRI